MLQRQHVVMPEIVYFNSIDLRGRIIPQLTEWYLDRRFCLAASPNSSTRSCPNRALTIARKVPGTGLGAFGGAISASFQRDALIRFTAYRDAPSVYHLQELGVAVQHSLRLCF